MKNNKPKIVIVCGPTSTGKSDYAVSLAKQINGEIISADSRQVYKGMDIGSGKITKKEMSGIPHYMLDVASPKKTFSASQYKKKSEKYIKDIIKKGKTPIICGGTGFYIDALIGLEFPNVKPNQSLRKILNKKSLDELGIILKRLDKNRYNEIDKNNKVRLIRSIEIAKQLGSVPKIKFKKVPYNIDWVGLDLDDNTLKERIRIRLLKRLKKGMISEVKKLHKSKISFKKLESFGLEYRFIAMYLQGKITKENMIEMIEKESFKYAKRQRTWFRKNKNINWINKNML
jgi:tRNA dimethylallyltransferase